MHLEKLIWIIPVFIKHLKIWCIFNLIIVVLGLKLN